MEDQVRLHRIESDRKIDKIADSEFLFEYQRAVLLALKESGTLNEMQYRYAEEILKKRLRTFVKKQFLCGNEDERRNAP